MMPQRLPSEAKYLADQEPIPNREHAKEAEEELGKATSQGQQFIAEQSEEVDVELREAQQSAAVGVRDGFDALVQAGQTEAISFEAFNERFDSLDGQLESLVEQRAELARRIEYLEQIEADPAAFTDQLYRRFPRRKRPDFSF